MYRLKNKKHPKVLLTAAILLVTFFLIYFIDNDLLVTKIESNQGEYVIYGINSQRSFLKHDPDVKKSHIIYRKNVTKKLTDFKIDIDFSDKEDRSSETHLKDVSLIINDPSIKHNASTKKENYPLIDEVKQKQEKTSTKINEKEQNEEASNKEKEILKATEGRAHKNFTVQKQTTVEHSLDNISSNYYDNSWKKVNVKLNNFLKQRTPPNKNFVFHNKMPKCGSSTMNNVLKVCSENENRYNFEKITAWNISMYNDKALVDHIINHTSPPYLLLKHHFYFDFKKFGRQQPTYINVIRDPLDWFTSRYYFARYGWARKPGCRKWEACSELAINMTIDECVAKRHPACTNSTYQYLPFLCGSEDECINTTLQTKKRAFEISKQHILNNYYFVGILEQFEETLLLAEFLLPDFYKNASVIWKSDIIQEKQIGTKTRNKQAMNEKSRKFFLEGPLKYEKKLYDLCRKVFNERLKYFKISIA